MSSVFVCETLRQWMWLVEEWPRMILSLSLGPPDAGSHTYRHEYTDTHTQTQKQMIEKRKQELLYSAETPILSSHCSKSIGGQDWFIITFQCNCLPVPDCNHLYKQPWKIPQSQRWPYTVSHCLGLYIWSGSHSPLFTMPECLGL